MSRESYSKWWLLTKDQLGQLQNYDAYMKQSTKTTRSRVLAGYLVAGLYVKYCMIVQDLDACLDQLAQVQKNVTIRKLMDAAVTRLHELKEILNEIDLSEFHYVDGALIELKLIPYNIEILDPALIFPRNENIQDMWEKVQRGERLYTAPPPPPPPRPTEKVDSMELLLNPQKRQQQQEEQEKVSEEKPPEESPPPQPEQEQPKDEKKAKRKPIKKFVVESKALSEEEIEEMKRKEKRSAILKLIQTHERARQARLYFLDCRREKRQAPDPSKGPLPKEVKPDPELVNKAATDFQRLYRGYTVRKDMMRQERDRRFLIGMISPSWRSNEEFEKVQRTIEKRREIVKQHVKEFLEANIKENDRIMRVVAPGLMEDIGDEIREWFYQWYIKAKCFDKIPPDKNGGTILVVRGETWTPEEYIDEMERQRKEQEREGKSGANKAKKEQEEKKKKEMEKKKKEEEKKKKEKEAKQKAKKRNQEFEFKFGESPADNLITQGFKEYKKLWEERKDEDNPDEKPYMDIITDEKCYQTQLEVRKKVDELMRVELDLLNEALAFDKGKKKKKGGKKKGKKGKGKGKKGKKGKKDLTANRSTEDLFQEFVDSGIIHTYPRTHLNDFRGDMSYTNWEKRSEEYDPLPSLGDVRQVVALTCILPLGVETMRRPRSVLIAGPRQCGKHLLANAIFTETKSVLFDLSPPILADKYQGKDGMKMLVHLINKLSRLLQPSVIFFDGAEKPFYKKVPKPEKDLDPKKMGKQLFKGIVKTIKPEDRVLVLGITKQPWAGKQKGLNKAFEKVILIPRTDYGSAYIYWYELLMAYHSVDRNINVSSLARFSINYPMGQIKKFVETLLQPRRIIQLAYNPLQQIELYDLMISWKEGPVTDKEFKKFIKWFNKTPLAKRKAKYMKIVERRREAEAKQAEKQVGKKK